MAFLTNLKFTTARKPRALPDVIKRRNKLVNKLTDQRELAIAFIEGRNYTPQRLRTVVDRATGERTVRQMPVRVKQWWWTGEKNEILLSVFYGSKTLELIKGKSAVELASVKELPTIFETLINAALNSELDTQIESASAKLRDGFKK
jgi:hypothetical protein